MKYQVIGSVDQFAITDFKCSLNKASKLKDARFSNGLAAKKWIWDFKTKHDALLFMQRCESILTYQSGRLGRWITPSFSIVKK